MTEIIIRKASLDDIDSLVACIDAAYAAFKERLPDLPAVSEGCAEAIANDPVWVAFVDGLVAGGIFLKPLPDAMKLANIAVHPNFSGRGIGRMLITKAEKESSAMGYCQMKLNTHIKMVENITMYAHLGWQEISRTGNTVTMSKDLNAD